MELASAMNSDDPMRQMGGMYDFVLAVLDPDQHGAFRDAMHSLDDDPEAADRLNEAIGELMVSYTNRPTERPSASPSGAEPTGRSSRVVSLSRGTVKAEPESSTDGAATGS